MMRRRRSLGVAVLLALATQARAATHSFEFVAEHFAEVGMNDRYATLPISSGADAAGSRGITLQAGEQRLGIERVAHKGIDKTWLGSASIRF